MSMQGNENEYLPVYLRRKLVRMRIMSMDGGST